MMNKRMIRQKAGIISFFILGIGSTIWFLIRVLPKPSRAAYPCIRATAPFMSGFLVYLTSVGGSALFLRRGWRLLSRGRFAAAFLIILLSLLVSVTTTTLQPDSTYAGVKGSSPEDYPANVLYGRGSGIFPGRVVWSWDPGATDENCTNQKDDPVRGEDGYFMEKNTDRQVISRMVDDMVTKLTGSTDVEAAWDSLFIALNRKKGLGDGSYQEGQIIFIKINQGASSWLANSSPDGDLSYLEGSSYDKYYGEVETTPVVVVEILDQLINGFGINAENIYVGDPMSHIYKHTYDQMVSSFPGVKYVDWDANHADIGRTILNPSQQPAMFYSDKGAAMHDAGTESYYSEMENADYLINIAALKAHALAGVTLTAKNHFGSITRDGASHLHPGLVAVQPDQPVRTAYGLYRVQTDIMGHKQLGGNTVLFIVDGLWGAPEAVEPPVKWSMLPFKGDWPSSIFCAQDQVALESVCFDFLRSEFDDPDGVGKARPWMGGVDDYLHQAADQQFWPAGISYDPENDGTPIGSLGVHEHWNNETDKAYSRNLGSGSGIELLQVDKTYQKEVLVIREAQTIPVIDGKHGDRCWIEADWHSLDQTWIPCGVSEGAEDFSSRYQLSWSAAENLLYGYVEVMDDHYIDGYAFPEEGFREFDVLELHLDENLSGGFHAYDGTGPNGTNAENAFSYRLLADVPADGSLAPAFHACDWSGPNQDPRITDYAGHFNEFALKRDGNLCTYEFSLKVYRDNYTEENDPASRTRLQTGAEMGFSLAYCDTDSPETGMKAYHGSVWVPLSARDDHWMDADYFGILRLEASDGSVNHEVEVDGSIPDFEITLKETDLVIHDQIGELFSDPDNDILEYSVLSDDDLLHFTIQNRQLQVWAGLGFTGEAMVELSATDGEYTASITFKVSWIGTVAINAFELGPGVVCYPNPFNDVLYIEIDRGGQTSVPATLAIYNLKGQLMQSQFIQLAADQMTTTRMILDQGSAGLYIVEVKVDGVTVSRMVRGL
ncbi:MAG: DUF362 domain-containing protein [Bacteroidota bacterium]